MSWLAIYDDINPAAPLRKTEDRDQIAQELAALKVEFLYRPVNIAIENSADADAVLAACGPIVAELKDRYGYQSADVVRIAKGTPDTAPLRAKFLSEHVHSDDESRYFVEGSGAFYLHGAGKVFMLVCTAGDYISVPAGTKHWFDMGEDPHFTALRLFTRTDGWVAEFTGDPIASRFPQFDSEAAA